MEHGWQAKDAMTLREFVHQTVTRRKVKQDRSSALRICVYLCPSVVLFCMDTAWARKSSNIAADRCKVGVGKQSTCYSRTIEPLDLVGLIARSERVPESRRDAMSTARAMPQPNCAKRLECAELAPVFEPPLPRDSASKLDALQTLRASAHPALCASGASFCS